MSNNWPQGWNYSRRMVRVKYREDNLHVFKNPELRFTKTFSGYNCNTEQAVELFIAWHKELLS